MNLNIGLSESSRQGSIALLSRLLADAHVLYIKTRGFHWNVTGPRFKELHALFEEQYDALAEEIDEVAERIRSLGGEAPAAMSEFIKHARLTEHSGGKLSGDQMIGALVADHEAIVRSLRIDATTVQDQFGDSGTNDFLVGLMEAHEKTAWMLRAHLE